MDLTDEELFEEFRKGSSNCFEELLGRYKGPLFSLILRRTRDRGQAEDIFQETFMRVIENADRFEAGRKFSPWVFRIASNLCVDIFRKKQTRSEVKLEEEGLGAGKASGIEEKMEGIQIKEKVDLALEKLTEEQRQVFIMREYSGMSFKEIAEATESPINTVLGRMHAAIKKLRVELAEEFQ